MSNSSAVLFFICPAKSKTVKLPWPVLSTHTLHVSLSLKGQGLATSARSTHSASEVEPLLLSKLSHLWKLKMSLKRKTHSRRMKPCSLEIQLKLLCPHQQIFLKTICLLLNTHIHNLLLKYFWKAANALGISLNWEHGLPLHVILETTPLHQ